MNSLDNATQAFKNLTDGIEVEVVAHYHNESHQHVIFWDDIQESIPGVTSIRNGKTIVPRARDQTYHYIDPRCIRYQPGVILTVVVGELSPPNSGPARPRTPVPYPDNESSMYDDGPAVHTHAFPEYTASVGFSSNDTTEDDEQAIPYAMRALQRASLSSSSPSSSAWNPSWLSFVSDLSLPMRNTLDPSSYVGHSLDQDQENKIATTSFALDSFLPAAIHFAISKIHSHGLKCNMNTPQMAIIGDQSSGKSSVLEALTKLSFPRDKGMCTRFATMVNLQRNSTLLRDVMSAKIEGEDAFNKRFAVIEAPITFESVIEEAVSLLCKNIDISDKILELTLSGPTHSPLTIIDLPGFIRTTKDAQDKTLPEAIRAINRCFIQDSRTIILAVVPANADLITSTSLSEARAYDPDGERTIPIVTKPDLIEGGLLPDWIEVILNRRKAMKMGYLVMRNTGFGQKKQSWDESCLQEERFFETEMWSSVPAERKGRVAICQFLIKVLHEHISRELPALKREVNATLDSFKRDLDAMSTPIVDTDEARQRLNIANMNLQPRVIAFLSGDYDQKYLTAFKDKLIPSSGLDPYFVRSSLLRLYHEYRSAMWKECNRLSKPEIVRQITRYKGSDLPGFVSFVTFKNIVNGHYLDGWRTVTEEHVLKMQDHLSKALSMFISHIADPSARDVFAHIFEQFSWAQAAKIKTTIQDIFGDESTPFTLSRHYMEVIQARSRNNTSPSLTHSLSIVNLDNGNARSSLPASFISPPPSQAGSPELSQPTQSSPHAFSHSQTDPMSTSSFSSQDSIASAHTLQQNQPQNSLWDDEHMAVEMLPCLLGYLATARERIIDKVLMQTIGRHMIKRITVYFTMVIKATNEELLCMLESPALKRRREDFANKISDFEAILRYL